MADEPKPQPKAEKKQLEPVILVHRFGYWTDEGELKMWLGGQHVSDPAEVADLIARGAHVTPAK